MLAGTASRVRGGFTPRRLRLVNLASGVLILGFGIQSLAAALLLT